MAVPNGLIAHLKAEQPALWKLLVQAAEQGLIVIDEEDDAITASNRLLLTYPDLHEILAHVVNSWSENRSDTTEHFKKLVTGASE